MPAVATATKQWTVKELLDTTTNFLKKRAVDSPRLSAEMLIGHVLGLERIGLYTNFNRIPSQAERDELRSLVRRAGDHEPVQYLVGKAGFFSLEFEVTPDVLIPRPDTETLVDAPLRWLKADGRKALPLRVLDVCTGSGCVGLALAKQLPAASVIATDLSAAAAKVATENAELLKLDDRVEVRVGDLFEPVSDEAKFDVIVSNPPYIPSKQIVLLDSNVRDYEPMTALDGGDDGLDFHRRLLAEAAKHLVDDGRLYLEMQYDQGPALIGLAKQHDWQSRVLPDLAGKDRVLEAWRDVAG